MFLDTGSTPVYSIICHEEGPPKVGGVLMTCADASELCSDFNGFALVTVERTNFYYN